MDRHEGQGRERKRPLKCLHILTVWVSLALQTTGDVDMPKQLDMYRDTPERMAKVYREAAEAALVNPFMATEDREARSRYYLREAERLEATT